LAARQTVDFSSLEPVSDFLVYVFAGDQPAERMQLHQVMARAGVVYLIGILLVRAGKSRLIARLSPLDVLVGFVLGSLLSRAITGHASISETVAASAALIAIHWIFTWLACRVHWFGNLVKGTTSLVIKDGKIIEEAMRRHHLSQGDIEQQIRQQGISDVSQVECAYKERSGEISVIRSRSEPKILDVKVEPGVQTVRIKLE
jgi:uncharacterized membrane protein YcaP (DUF421 family)